MKVSMTLLLALAVFAVFASQANGQDYNKGPNNYGKQKTNVGTGVQSAVNKASTHASNKNQGYNIAGKTEVENAQIAQDHEHLSYHQHY